MLRTISELKGYIVTLENVPKQHRIAVGSLIFTPEDKIILLERGDKARDAQGKLEGVGGSLDASETNLIRALRREIKEELGKVEVEVSELLTIMTLPGTNNSFWVVPVYLCKLLSGEPTIMEPEKCSAIRCLSLNEIDQDGLSDFQRKTMEAYQKKYHNKPFYSI